MPDYNYYPMPDQSLVQQLERTISEHPLYLTIRQQPYCSGPLLADFDAREIEHWQVSEDLKSMIYARLGKRKGLVYVLEFKTAEEERWHPLGGHGAVYDFLIHSQTHEVLHVIEGMWES